MPPINNLHISKQSYLFVFLLLVLSGNPITFFVGEWIYIIAMLFMLFYVAILSKQWISSDFMRFTAATIVLLVLQKMIIEKVSIPADINFLARIYCGFLIINLIGTKFRYVYFKTMVFISSISLILFALNFIGINFPGISFDRYCSVIFYNYITNAHSLPRNSGMFWEPGAFQGYLILVALLYIDEIKVLWHKERRGCIILIIALLTTFSTTGYITFATLIFLLVMKKVKNPIYKFFMIAAVLSVSFFAFNKLEFLGDKMTEEFNNATKITKGDVSWTRMGSAYIDLINIERHPMVGNGFLMEQKYVGIGEKMAGAGNGFTGVVNSLGIPFMLFFLYMIFRKAPTNSNYEKFCFLITIILMLNGEYFLNYPLFWCLIFIKYPSLNKNVNETNRCINDGVQSSSYNTTLFKRSI